ncbi:hypothetical protein EII20_14115, partial [Comamonadaceae bacterium OH2545_COT-014]
YYDEETGTHYNFHRDYKPNLGRYLQSDPIGLNGGVNWFEYAASNSIKYIDASGQIAIVPPPPLIPIGPPSGGAGAGNSNWNPGEPRPPVGVPIPNIWPRSPGQEPCWRYEYRDCNGDLVYIGITNNLERRAKEHEYDGVVAKYACPQCKITKTYWEETPNRSACSFREKLSIIWKRPIFNTTYNPDPLPILLLRRYVWRIENCSSDCDGG